jgi:DNA-directed RNA polymerase specialized sigma24 family protein
MRDEIERILGAIELMPPDRALLLLRVTLEQLPLKDAAKELGITPQTASSRLGRAKKELEKLLKKPLRHRS